MSNILSILNELSDPSILKKKEVLKREKDNELLKKVFFLAYDPFTKFWIKKIPEYECRSSSDTKELDFLLDYLVGVIAGRELTGYSAIHFLSTILSSSSKDDAEVICRVVGKDLRCGTGVSLANKTWPGLITELDNFQLAYKDISGIKFPAYGQIKADGMRVHCHFSDGTVSLFTRGGNEVLTHGLMDSDAKVIMKEGETWDGELVCYRGTIPLDRKTSNGLANKGVRGTVSEEEAMLYRVVVWDIVDWDGKLTQEERLNELDSRFIGDLNDNGDFSFIRLETRILNSAEEAQVWFNEVIEQGIEGLILKNMDSTWAGGDGSKGRDRKVIGKMKAENVADLRVVGWYRGDVGKKYENDLGGLVCQTEDGLLEVNVGGGFSDEDRKKDPESWVGGIIGVIYNQRIKAKDKDTESLFLPRYDGLGLRLDKITANNLKDLK